MQQLTLIHPWQCPSCEIHFHRASLHLSDYWNNICFSHNDYKYTLKRSGGDLSLKTKIYIWFENWKEVLTICRCRCACQIRVFLENRNHHCDPCHVLCLHGLPGRHHAPSLAYHLWAWIDGEKNHQQGIGWSYFHFYVLHTTWTELAYGFYVAYSKLSPIYWFNYFDWWL